MSYVLYDFMDARGVNRIKKWTQGLEKEGRVRLKSKFDMLEMHGEELSKRVLTGTEKGMVKKLKVTCTRVPTMRIMVCKGPLDMDKEFTILQGAIEKDDKLDPPDAVDIANQQRTEIIDCDQRKSDKKNRCNNERRCLHEHVD